MLALRSVPGTLLIAGDGPARTQLERFAARLDLKDRARFLGKVPRDEDLAAYYLASEAFWFPSNARSEAYGLVQVEAMASGCPVINTAIPHSGVPWVSRHEETGLTVPVDDPAAFAAAALRLLEEPGLRDRLAAGARARAISEFHCDAMGQPVEGALLHHARGRSRQLGARMGRGPPTNRATASRAIQHPQAASSIWGFCDIPRVTTPFLSWDVLSIFSDSAAVIRENRANE